MARGMEGKLNGEYSYLEPLKLEVFKSIVLKRIGVQWSEHYCVKRVGDNCML